MASAVREQLHTSVSGAIDGSQLFEGLDDIPIRDRSGRAFPLRGYVSEIGESEGLARFDSDRGRIEILVAPKTYRWLETGHPRGAYLVAHELGHCVLHTDQLVRLASMPVTQQAGFHRGGGPAAHAIYFDTEWQANGFASALLMPAQGLLALEEQFGELTQSSVAGHFGVSREAAGYRLNLFGSRRTRLI